MTYLCPQIPVFHVSTSWKRLFYFPFFDRVFIHITGKINFLLTQYIKQKFQQYFPIWHVLLNKCKNITEINTAEGVYIY